MTGHTVTPCLAHTPGGPPALAHTVSMRPAARTWGQASPPPRLSLWFMCVRVCGQRGGGGEG